MKSSGSILRRWLPPAMLAAAALIALVAVPVVAGQKGVTKTQLKQQSNGKYLHIKGPVGVDDDTGWDYGSPQAVLALPKGNYLLSATFTLKRDAGSSGIVPICRFGTNVVGGSKFDALDGFHLGENEVVTMTSAAKVHGSNSAKLACADGSPDADDSRMYNISITAEEVPKLSLNFTE